MNKMAEIAKIFGLELKQLFVIKEKPFKSAIFWFGEDGLHCSDMEIDDYLLATILVRLMTGKYKAESMEWKLFHGYDIKED